MAGDILGTVFRVVNFGESHGPVVGAVIEGCPPLLPLQTSEIQADLDRRAPGKSGIATSRREEDQVQILSGMYEGKTTGAPICLMIANKDHRSEDYHELSRQYRPSHADFAYDAKYGIRDPRGGGRSSARLTAPTVAAGAIAKKILATSCSTVIRAYTVRVGSVAMERPALPEELGACEENAVRCPDPALARQMEQAILDAKQEGDSLGGIIECRIDSVPKGLGEPLYDRLDADLAKAMLAINATKGFELGSGFSGSALRGSQHNDAFIRTAGGIATATNHSGGIQGGISNGMPIVFRVAFKPTATISKPQKSIDSTGCEIEISPQGRHDPCVVPRAVPVVEAMAALVLCDHLLRFKAQCRGFPWTA